MADPSIEALLRERAGYLVRGMDDRVAAVDAALEALGHRPRASAPETTSKAAPEKAVRPRGRPREAG